MTYETKEAMENALDELSYELDFLELMSIGLSEIIEQIYNKHFEGVIIGDEAVKKAFNEAALSLCKYKECCDQFEKVLMKY